MRGIILAAGRGSRLKHITDDRPKCLVPVAGKALLDWQLEAMHEVGIEKVLVVRGYRKEDIKGAFEVVDNPRWAETHMVASLCCARDWLQREPCIVSYADIVYDQSAVARLTASASPLSILYDVNWQQLWKRRFDDPMADAESFRIAADGRLIEIGRKGVSVDEVQGQYMGLLHFTPESYAWVEALLLQEPGLVDRLDMTSLLSLLIEAGKSVFGVPWDGVWCEVDSGDDLAVANQLWPPLP